MSTDAELLRRYAEEGDEAAFTELVRRNLPTVYNAALRQLHANDSLAREAAQVVFADLACKARKLARHPALLGWLFTSARFAANAIGRREQRLKRREEIAAMMPDTRSDNPSWEMLKPLLDEALEQLNERDRHALVLRFFGGRSHAEVGSELHVTEEAARKCISRALERLRAVLARRGVTTTAEALGLVLAATPVIAAPATLAAEVASFAMSSAAAGVGASVGVAGVAGVLKTSTVAVATLGLVATLSVGIGFATWIDHQQALARQLDAMHEEAAGIRSRLGQLRNESVAAVRPAAPTSGGNVDAGAVDPTTAREMESARYYDKILKDPIYRRISQREYRWRAQRGFGAFIASRGYSPEQVSALRSALIAYYEAEDRVTVDVHLAMASPTGDRKQAEAGLARAKQAFFDAVGTMFSEAEFADVRRCFNSQQEAPAARSVSLQLAFDGMPLDKVQELSLAMVLADADAAEERLSAEEKRRRSEVDPASGLSLGDRDLLADASAFMTPDQLRLYEEHLRLQRRESELRAKVRKDVEAEL